jgi:phosphoribosylanthranilate isomerase
MSIKLKICGMRVPENIAAVIALEPDYIGFIFYPGSKRFVAVLDPQIVKSIPEPIKATGVFVDEKIEIVKEKIAAYGLKAVQLHGKETPAYCKELQKITEVIKAFGIDGSFDFDRLDDYYDVTDYYLFDTQTAQHGGSGKSFNWRLLEKYQLPKPFFISGGIGLENVAELPRINDERLYGADVNSRFENPEGLKDIDQLTDFKNKMLSYL